MQGEGGVTVQGVCASWISGLKGKEKQVRVEVRVVEERWRQVRMGWRRSELGVVL